MSERKKPLCRIKLGRGYFGNDEGDIVNVWFEGENELYYYDGFRRWCYVNKSDEGNDWEYVGRKRPPSIMKFRALQSL